MLYADAPQIEAIVLPDETAPISSDLTDPDTFQQLSAIVDGKLGKLLKIKADLLGEKVIMGKAILKIIHFILSAKDLVWSVVSADPHAALAWSGVVFVLSVSLASRILDQPLFATNVFPARFCRIHSRKQRML